MHHEEQNTAEHEPVPVESTPSATGSARLTPWPACEIGRALSHCASLCGQANVDFRIAYGTLRVSVAGARAAVRLTVSDELSIEGDVQAQVPLDQLIQSLVKRRRGPVPIERDGRIVRIAGRPIETTCVDSDAHTTERCFQYNADQCMLNGVKRSAWAELCGTDMWRVLRGLTQIAERSGAAGYPCVQTELRFRRGDSVNESLETLDARSIDPNTGDLEGIDYKSAEVLVDTSGLCAAASLLRELEPTDFLIEFYSTAIVLRAATHSGNLMDGRTCSLAVVLFDLHAFDARGTAADSEHLRLTLTSPGLGHDARVVFAQSSAQFRTMACSAAALV